jgi:hypothetical protein
MIAMKKTVLAVLGAAILSWGLYRGWVVRPPAGSPADHATASEPPPSVVAPAPAPVVEADRAPAGSKQESASAADVPPEVESVVRRDKHRHHGEPKDPAQAQADLERTGRVLAESIPWLEQRRLEAERAGRDDEARTLALRAKRLNERLKLVEQGVDPDSPSEVRNQGATPPL